MQNQFKGYFPPNDEEFKKIWGNCIFAFDANVLLNLYRYSGETRAILESTLRALQDRIFLPNQAAKEFLNNRLNVTAGQAEEYQKSIDQFKSISSQLLDKKRHPHLDDKEHASLGELTPRIVAQLELKRGNLLKSLNDDKILATVKELFNERTGAALDEKAAAALRMEGEDRFKLKIPPGFKDQKKEAEGDINRKFGDLFIWKQIIEKSKETKKPLIFVTDDKKEDWWLEQSGKTIGPLPALVTEFLEESQQGFWMYQADSFVQQASHITNVKPTPAAIDEIKTVNRNWHANETLATRSEWFIRSLRRDAQQKDPEAILRRIINFIGIENAKHHSASALTNIISTMLYSPDIGLGAEAIMTLASNKIIDSRNEITEFGLNLLRLIAAGMSFEAANDDPRQLEP